jgi:hypothetical protein
MSDGGIGNGLSYRAIISISGDLNKDELKDVIAKIENILAPVNGRIESDARTSSNTTSNVNFTPKPK